jgi:transposase
MIIPGPATRIFLAPGATDLRRSFDGLHGLVVSQLAEDPRSGHLFLFCNKPRTRLKVLCFDGTGLWVCAKRLEQGRFTWPPAATGAKVRLTSEELALLLGGLELTRVSRRDWWRAEGHGPNK